MHIQDKIMLVIGSEEDKSLQGRTILQKKLYFLSILLDDDSLGFGPHYYGPYSRRVAEGLDILVNLRFLKEVTETFPTDQNILGEIRRHTYTLTSDGEEVMGEIQREHGYADWQQALDKLNSQPFANDFNTLSIAAKVHYIVHHQGSATRKQIRETAEGYGWDINESQIEDVLSFLEALSLISVGEAA